MRRIKEPQVHQVTAPLHLDREREPLLRERARIALSAAADFAESHPLITWTVLAVISLLVAICGMADWPVATKTNGGDPLGIQTVMALSYDSSPSRWVTGPSIDERSYRPLCMLLHWLEFRYWGTHDV